MHGALEGQMRGKVAKDMLYIPYPLGGRSEFMWQGHTGETDMTQKHTMAE